MKSFSENIAKLVGEYKEKEIYSYYAVPNAGKTLFLLQEASNLTKAGIRVLWLDTEGGFAGMEEWKKKFGLVADKFFYYQFFDYEELMKFLGFDVSVEYGKGKVEVSMNGRVKKEDKTIYAEGFGRLKGDTAIFLDSLTSLFRLKFSDSTQNFPARATATGFLVYALLYLASKTNAIVITSNHASLNPTNPYTNLGLIRGGNTVSYYSKYIIYIEKPRKRALEDYRKFWGVRLPNAREWEKAVWLKIDNSGFKDVSDDEVKNVLGGEE